jgi:hypothetical protein
MFSQLTEDDLNLGLPSDDLDALLELGDVIATSRPSVIVHLQEWVRDEEV